MSGSPSTGSTNLLRAGGFSMMELMLVMIVVSILSTLVLLSIEPSRKRAADAAVKSDLRAAMFAEEAHFADGLTYVAFAVGPGGAVTTPEFRASVGVSVTATVTGSQVMIVGSHGKANHAWCVSSASGGVVAGNTC